jgi:uncharacterized protein with HEPN domain
MPHSAERYLFDIQSACIRIGTYIAGLQFETYTNVNQVRDSVERCIGIIGEALRQALHHHPEMAPLFPEARAVIGMRNILSHEYGEVNDAMVWLTAREHVPQLLARVSEELERRKREND